MTPEEKQQFLQWFPTMQVNDVVVTGEATPKGGPGPVYNCVALSLGMTDRWINLNPPVKELYDTFYAGCGFSYGVGLTFTVAAWGYDDNDMKHVCISGPGFADWQRAESKFGYELRAQHHLGDLQSGMSLRPSIYGKPIAYYTINSLPRGGGRESTEAVDRRRSPAVLTNDHRATVRAESAKLSPELRRQFEEAFAAWTRALSLPEIAFSSNTASATHSAEFQRLLALGPDTIPAVVEKLIEPDNFFALQLYDRLQSRRHLTVSFDPASDEFLEGEQGRALRTVQRFATSL
jgi:hypothetical protein